MLNMYSNYSGVVAAPMLIPGTTYPFSVTVGMCGATAFSGGISIFVDYNQNGVFDATEKVFGTTVTQAFAIAGTAVTGNITIPLTAMNGLTRMRVVEVESNATPVACGTYTWGETAACTSWKRCCVCDSVRFCTRTTRKRTLMFSVLRIDRDGPRFARSRFGTNGVDTLPCRSGMNCCRSLLGEFLPLLNRPAYALRIAFYFCQHEFVCGYLTWSP